MADHATLAVDRLPTAFKETSVEDLVRVLASGFQDLEEGVASLALDVETAEGTQLDGIGQIVGQLRETTDDEAYRLRIKVRIAINRSGGRTEDVLQTLAIILPAGSTQALREEFPAAFTIRLAGTDHDSVAAEWTRILGELKGAGIAARLEYTRTSPAGTFTFDGVAGQGFDDGVMTDGRRA